MNKIKTLLASAVTLVLPALAFAQINTAPVGAGNIDQPNSVGALVDNITNLTGLVFGTIAVIMFVVAGILFMTAQGDPEKIKTARGAFMWGIVGVAVGIIAWGVITLTSTIFTAGA